MLMLKKYVVELEEEERANLKSMVSKGKAAARMIQHAHVLLQADSAAGAPDWKDEQIAEIFDVHSRTVARIRQRFVEHGLDDALRRRLQPHGRKPRLDGIAEAQLTQIACSEPPEGRQRWTLRLLANRLVELEVVDEISYETIRQSLKKTNSSLG
jgi:transposase